MLLNILGSLIMFSLPYTVGKKGGASAVEDLRKKYPKVAAVQDMRGENDFLFAFLARMVRLPSDVVSLYMGAVNVKYQPYLLGSLLGLLPHMILFPIMGMEIENVHSPAFLAALGGEIAYVLVTMAVYALYRKRKKSTK